ncbi:lipase secretion chaperone [Variovorax ginsengisoli]|uniref:Lipase chaperone n=1 Tax=Variovorax ginsengisoli TaxID=363844 RepID=A0ABT9S5C2_9BURK|nr:lipase secretion chaperone [Variovorax ginsengisoli]MDP9899089.1 lipase chaperone LimK [Variovorax ginsengisoli]
MRHLLVVEAAPSRRRRRFIVCITGLAVVLALALWVWASGRGTERAPVAPAPTPRGLEVWLHAGSTMTEVDTAPATADTGLEALPASLQGTEVSGELEVDEHGRLKVTRGLRLLFDYFLSASGEEPVERQRERIRAYITHRWPGAAAEQALVLLDSYIAYKDELSRVLSGSRATSLSDMQARLGAVAFVRARYFQPEEVVAFFGEEQGYDRYSLAKMSILNDPALSPAQKAAHIAELRGTQPEAVRQQMDVSETVQTLEALTTAWQQRTGSPQELRDVREKLVGRDAADRLESLDRQTQAWDGRVAAYLQQREKILGDTTLADSMRQQQVEALRNEAFAGPERIRIETIQRIQDSAARDAAPVPRSATSG